MEDDIYDAHKNLVFNMAEDSFINMKMENMTEERCNFNLKMKKKVIRNE